MNQTETSAGVPQNAEDAQAPDYSEQRSILLATIQGAEQTGDLTRNLNAHLELALLYTDLGYDGACGEFRQPHERLSPNGG